MAGIEIAGLVLGSFPILLKCLDCYRQVFETLEDWWNFRTHFIAFVDDIRHQMMRYNENIIQLLDPMFSDNDSLIALVRNARDPRWTDGSLDILLEQRLASEYGRVVRIIKRMEEVMGDLKKLLKIQDDDVGDTELFISHVSSCFLSHELIQPFAKVCWIGSEEERPWEWHLMRIKISFSKGKTRKVKRLAKHNQELQEILGYSERIIPIFEARKPSGPVALFEEIRQHACAVHNALKRHWICPDQVCRPHQAYLNLRAEAKNAHLNVLFVLGGEQGSSLQPVKQEVVIQPVKHSTVAEQKTSQLGYAIPVSSFTAVQERFKNAKKIKETPSFSKMFSKSPKNTPSTLSSSNDTASLTSKHGKQTRFDIPTRKIRLNEPKSLQYSTAANADIKQPSGQYVVNLCSSLRKCQDASLGVISDEFDRQFQLSKLSAASSDQGVRVTVGDTARLMPLPELLDAYQRTNIEIARQSRFGMAVHIASALLQIQMSPWLSNRWSKHELYFLADAHSVWSDHLYISETFVSNMTVPSGSLPKKPSNSLPIFEDDSRACLFTVGVIILELIFGCNIEACKFRHLYFGSNNQPNDQTDISTARRWAQQVLGECGVEIADVVRRCLDCSFGPKPSFKDQRFREAVYEGVIRPLAEYSKIWPVTVP